MSGDYHGLVTERPGIRASNEQLSMLITRYALAAEHAEGRDVVEVACGAGLGLPYLARRARRVIGGDIDADNLAEARRLSADTPDVGLLRCDIERLPLTDASCDLLCCFEAIYYLREPARLAREAARVLRPGGLCIVGSVNREWPGFNPSPLSTRYLSAAELVELLAAAGFAVELRVGFEDRPDKLVSRMLRCIRRAAIRMHLIPESLKAKERLKRLVMGPLTPIPERLDDALAEREPLRTVDPALPQCAHKMLYCLARLPEAR